MPKNKSPRFNPVNEHRKRIGLHVNKQQALFRKPQSVRYEQQPNQFAFEIDPGVNQDMHFILRSVGLQLNDKKGWFLFSLLFFAQISSAFSDANIAVPNSALLGDAKDALFDVQPASPVRNPVLDPLSISRAELNAQIKKKTVLDHTVKKEDQKSFLKQCNEAKEALLTLAERSEWAKNSIYFLTQETQFRFICLDRKSEYAALIYQGPVPSDVRSSFYLQSVDEPYQSNNALLILTSAEHVENSRDDFMKFFNHELIHAMNFYGHAPSRCGISGYISTDYPHLYYPLASVTETSKRSYQDAIFSGFKRIRNYKSSWIKKVQNKPLSQYDQKQIDELIHYSEGCFLSEHAIVLEKSEYDTYIKNGWKNNMRQEAWLPDELGPLKIVRLEIQDNGEYVAWVKPTRPQFLLMLEDEVEGAMTMYDPNLSQYYEREAHALQALPEKTVQHIFPELYKARIAFFQRCYAEQTPSQIVASSPQHVSFS